MIENLTFFSKRCRPLRADVLRRGPGAETLEGERVLWQEASQALEGDRPNQGPDFLFGSGLTTSRTYKISRKDHFIHLGQTFGNFAHKSLTASSLLNGLDMETVILCGLF